MSTKQIIQNGPEPATVSAVALTVWEALERWPLARWCTNDNTTSKPPPPPTTLADRFLRDIARGYQRCDLPPPYGLDDLEAIGEEVEDSSLESAFERAPIFCVGQIDRFWNMARRYHEVITWLQSPAGQECFWIQTEDELPLDGQAVIYYFDVVGAHVGWHFSGDGGGWTSSNGSLGHEVSHWIPLPGIWPSPPAGSPLGPWYG